MSKVSNKLLSILSVFSMDCPNLNANEIVKRNGLPTSTTYRFIRTLLKLGYLSKDFRNETYHLGPEILRLARISESKMDFRSHSIPWMDWLQEKTNETIYLSIRLRTSRLCLESREPKGSGIRFSVKPGQIVGPIYAGGAGKVLLAYMRHSELDAILNKVKMVKVTPRTVVNHKQLFMQLAEIRKLGYAYSEEESIRGVWGIAAPLLNENNLAEAVMTISGVIDWRKRPPIAHFSRLLLKVTRNISKQLGCGLFL